MNTIFRGAVKRYMQGKAQWDKKYPSKKIEAQRKRNIKQAAKYEANRLARHALNKETKPRNEESDTSIREERRSSDEEEELQGTWAAVDGERPPPSSIAARRDTVSEDSLHCERIVH